MSEKSVTKLKSVTQSVANTRVWKRLPTRSYPNVKAKWLNLSASTILLWQVADEGLGRPLKG
jgi:hypothetical protein